MKKSILLLNACLLTAAALWQGCNGKNGSTGSGDAVNLKMNLAPGAKYSYAMDMKLNMEQSMMGQNIKTNQDMIMEFSYDVAAGEGGDKKLTVNYDRIAMKMTNPLMNMEYDSREGGKKDSMLAPMTGILNKPFSVTMSETGEIKKIEGLEAMLNGITGAGTPAEGAVRRQIAASFNDTFFRNIMQQSFDIYPNKTVKPGDTWTKQMSVNMGPMNMRVDNTFKLASVSGGIAHLDITSKITSDGKPVMQGGQETKMDISGDSKGTMDVEVATGLVTDSKVKQTIKGNISVATMNVPMNITNDIHITGKKK